ncbi:MAG: MATE family efflux transporter [Solobacterium sp.]|nr:MATE family efflux transporter [Solobacterium sp.]
MSRVHADQTDFSKGSVGRVILNQSLPLMAAQLIHLLYNIVDRIFIGHMPGDVGTIALTGVGLAFPLTTIIAAFTNLFSSGGAPLFAIARGEKNETKAELILNQVMMLLTVSSIIMTIFCYAFRRPILYLFGASDVSYPYANTYLKIYLVGTVFTMISTGMNSFINAQGYPRHGMITVASGAFINLVLDPIFIYIFHMGVAGAALATVISQAVSFLWVMWFFYSDITLYHFKAELWKPDGKLIREISTLGLTGFIMQGTNSLVQIVCNVTLRTWGGDLYVGVMTVINSVREVLSMPCQSITQGSQPVISYNYGARNYTRIRASIKFSTLLAGVYTLLAWTVVVLFPRQLMSIFTPDESLITTGARALSIYFFGFVFMTLQFAGQSTFTALRCVKRAVFFSLFRKVLIVVPLTILLPQMGFGVTGVYMAEPISNLVGGAVSFITMVLTVYRKLPQTDGEPAYF